METKKLLNIRRLKEETEVSDETLRTLLQVFQEEAPRSLEALLSALKKGDMERLRHTAHSLKGSAAVTGAEALSELCLDMQTLAEEKRAPEAAKTAPMLKKTFEKTLGSIKKELKKLSEG